MKSLKQASQEAKKNQTLLISDLPSVDVNMELQNYQGVDFEYDFMEVEGKKYRVPKSVQLQIKELLQENPNLERVSVQRRGTTKNDTVYTTSVA